VYSTSTGRRPVEVLYTYEKKEAAFGGEWGEASEEVQDEPDSHRYKQAVYMLHTLTV